MSREESAACVAAVYDVHGNLPALEAVLAEIAALPVDLVVFGGDVFDGPFPLGTMERVRSVDNARFVRGNGERLVARAAERGRSAAPADKKAQADAWCASQLAARVGFLARFDDSLRIEIPSLGRVLFCHATPRSDEEIVTPQTPVERIRPMLGGVDADVIVMGHTHIQGERTVDAVRLVNPGSVGWPYADKPGAYWALLGGHGVEFRCTVYDLEAAARRIRDSGWPLAAEFAQENVLRVPSAAEAIAVFERAACG